MDNPHKGEVSIEAAGAKYTLCFSIDALCRLEETTGLVLTDLVDQMADSKRMSVTRVRQLLHAALFEHHPEIPLKQAGELMLKAGGMLRVMGKVTEAMQAAFPEASGTPRPPQPPNRAARRRAGTGRAS